MIRSEQGQCEDAIQIESNWEPMSAGYPVLYDEMKK